MKVRIIFSALVAASIFFSIESDAQTVHGSPGILNKEVQADAVKEARKEAKILDKEGYDVLAGALPLARQLEELWLAKVTIDTDGAPYYFIATSVSEGSDLSEVFKSASDAARLDIAGQIQARISSVIEHKVADGIISADNAEAINLFLNASKSVIGSTLDDIITFMEVCRTLGDGNIQAQVALGCNMEMATRKAILAMRDSLDEDAEDLIRELDVLLS